MYIFKLLSNSVISVIYVTKRQEKRHQNSKLVQVHRQLHCCLMWVLPNCPVLIKQTEYGDVECAVDKDRRLNHGSVITRVISDESLVSHQADDYLT